MGQVVLEQKIELGYGENAAEVLERGAASFPLRRLGTVEDCAKVVEFLATDLSDYVTGAVIPIDGDLVRR